MKRTAVLILALLIPSICFAQGTPVRHLTGSGVPSGSVASLEGTEYIDTSVSPPVLYVCSSVSVASGPTPPAGTQTCNWTSVGSGGGISSPVGYQGKLFNTTDAAYGLSTSNTAAANNTAISTLCTAVNAYAGSSNEDIPVVFTPGGSAGVNATYAYSVGCNFTRPVAFTCGPGATFNYSGSAHEMDFGPTGLTSTTLSQIQASSSIYEVSNCTFTGGASATEGLFFNQFVFQPKIHNNRFYDNGNNGANVFSVYISPNISACDISENYFNNDDNVARNGIRVDATSGFNDQCHVIKNIFENTFWQSGSASNTATNFGIGIWVDGQGSIVSENNMGFCAPCIRVGATQGAFGTRVTSNYLEGPGSAVSTPLIQYGSPGVATFVDSAFIIGNFFLSNNTANVLMGPASATTGLTNAMFANNRISGTFTLPLVVTNNVAGQTGNSFLDDLCGSTQCTQAQIVTIAGSVVPWGAPNYQLLLPDGTAGAPQIAFASLGGSVAAGDFGLRKVTSSNNVYMEVDGNANNTASGVGFGIAAQNATNASAQFYLNHASDTQTFPNRGFTIRHSVSATIDGITDWEGFPIAFLTGAAGSPAQRFTVTTSGIALGATPTMFISTTAPTIAAAGCGGAAAAISGTPNGTAAFAFSVGTTPGTTCSLTMPTATTAWNCSAYDITSPTTAGGYYIKPTTGTNTTTLVLGFFSSAGSATAPTASDVVRVNCAAY